MDDLNIRKLLSGLDSSLIEAIINDSQRAEIAAETTIMEAGAYVSSVPMVLEGMIKVSRRDEDKELLLYYIHPGELCIMSFSACCSNTSSSIVASTLESTSLLLLPSIKLRKWLTEFPSLNYYIYNQFNHRYIDLIDTINHLLYTRLDERLLHYLERKQEQFPEDLISITHQQIANDLGTAREVVSRILKKLEREGKLELGRQQLRLKSVKLN